MSYLIGDPGETANAAGAAKTLFLGNRDNLQYLTNWDILAFIQWGYIGCRFLFFSLFRRFRIFVSEISLWRRVTSPRGGCGFPPFKFACLAGYRLGVGGFKILLSCTCAP